MRCGCRSLSSTLAGRSATSPGFTGSSLSRCCLPVGVLVGGARRHRTRRAALLSHVTCALIAARTVSIRTLTLGTLVGVLFVLAYSLAFGEYHYDALDGSYSFVGTFASKNQLGLFSSLGLFFAFAAIFILHERGLWRMLAIACGALSAYALAASQSAASVIATAATLAAVIGLGVILMFSPRTRKVGLLAATVLAIAIVFVGLNLGAMDLLLGAFGKDDADRPHLPWSQGWQAAASTAARRRLPGVLGAGFAETTAGRNST